LFQTPFDLDSRSRFVGKPVKCPSASNFGGNVVNQDVPPLLELAFACLSIYPVCD